MEGQQNFQQDLLFLANKTTLHWPGAAAVTNTIAFASTNRHEDRVLDAAT